MTTRPHVDVIIRRHLPEQIVARAESLTEPGRWHTVVWTARDGWRCSCVVGLRKRKTCLHIDAVIEQVGT